ncbi:MAG: transposase [Aggregatilineales bacterium]
MAQLASVGDFCPKPDCPVYGDTGANAIIKNGKTRQGRQRFQCKVCKKTFNERHGTLFYAVLQSQVVSLNRVGRYRNQHQQFLDRPDVVSQPGCHCWRAS